MSGEDIPIPLFNSSKSQESFEEWHKHNCYSKMIEPAFTALILLKGVLNLTYWNSLCLSRIQQKNYCFHFDLISDYCLWISLSYLPE